MPYRIIRLSLLYLLILVNTRTTWISHLPVVTESRVAQLSSRPVVHGVMFWMEGCSNCEKVIKETLPPSQAKYGDQLDLLLVEIVTQADVDKLYAVGAAFGIPKDRVGVPFLILGEQVLIGSVQIPTQLPGLIDKYLAAGGLGYPKNPILNGLLPIPSTTGVDLCAPSSPCVEATKQAQNSSASIIIVPVASSRSDPTQSSDQPQSSGFSLAILILIGMGGALVYTIIIFIRAYSGQRASSRAAWLDHAMPVLALIGLGVAGYLTYVETQSVSAVCGPIGDCNSVQTSPYAKVLGVLPVGLLGAFGYIAILVVWFYGRFRSDRLSEYAPLAIFGMTFFGTLYSLYLTFIELFVIKAVCIWCLSSTVIITLLMLLSLNPAMQSLEVDDEEPTEDQE